MNWVPTLGHASKKDKWKLVQTRTVQNKNKLRNWSKILYRRNKKLYPVSVRQRERERDRFKGSFNHAPEMQSRLTGTILFFNPYFLISFQEKLHLKKIYCEQSIFSLLITILKLPIRSSNYVILKKLKERKKQTFSKSSFYRKYRSID